MTPGRKLWTRDTDLPDPASVVSPLGAGVEIHPVDDRVYAAVEDGGQVDDVLDKARDHL